MSAGAPAPPGSAAKARDRRRVIPRGLSGRLLLLSALFVMIAEVFIFLPSAGRYQLTYLRDHLADAHLAVQAVDFMPEGGEVEMVKSMLLKNTGARLISIRREAPGEQLGPRRMMVVGEPPAVDLTVRTDGRLALGLIMDTVAVMLRDDDRLLRVIGRSPRDSDYVIEAVIPERPLREALFAYSGRILVLSLIIASLTAGLLFISLRWIIVRPLQRLTASLQAFGRDPEDASTMISTTDRRDEIGVAQRELRRMQKELRQALVQKTRLAALGSAVTKFNHDLRNTLATAMLVADRLALVEDQKVANMAKPLIETIDRATRLCQESLRFARDGAPEVNAEPSDLRALVDAVMAEQRWPEGDDMGGVNDVKPGTVVRADPFQLHRVLSNLILNAVEAGATRVTVKGRALKPEGMQAIDVSDNGPGIPPVAREHLFQPFRGSSKSGGSGLGLAIARDLMHAHGGDVVLLDSGAGGCTFRLTLPVDQRAEVSTAAA